MTDGVDEQRRGARRNAILLGVIAFAVFVAFILAGVLRGPSGG